MSLLLSIAMLAAPATEVAVNEEQDEMSKVVCKRMPPPVGTRLGRRKVCATKAQWAEQKREQTQQMDKMQTRSGQASN